MNSLTRDQVGLMFRTVVETCENNLYDPRLNRIDWRHIAEKRRGQILAAESEEELEREFNELIKELKVSHAGFYHEKRPRAAGKMAISATLFRAVEGARDRWVSKMYIPEARPSKLVCSPAIFCCASARMRLPRLNFPYFH